MKKTCPSPGELKKRAVDGEENDERLTRLRWGSRKYLQGHVHVSHDAVDIIAAVRSRAWADRARQMRIR